MKKRIVEGEEIRTEKDLEEKPGEEKEAQGQPRTLTHAGTLTLCLGKPQKSYFF